MWINRLQTKGSKLYDSVAVVLILYWKLRCNKLYLCPQQIVDERFGFELRSSLLASQVTIKVLWGLFLASVFISLYLFNCSVTYFKKMLSTVY